MECPRCRAENRSGRRFCAACGASLAVACPSCGFANEPDERFCGGCGALVRGAGAAAEPRFGSPRDYTPGHLAEKILTARAALEGERKQVTVLFADLKGSLELLAGRDPEEARTLLDPVLERLIQAVHFYEGTVNQIMGDGIMALFGAPVAHEDHAVRACYAALAMQEAIRRYAVEIRRTHGVETQIRVGLTSGEVVVRAISNDLRMDYSAIGTTTHLAARMEQLATPGTIRLSAETLRLAEGFVRVRPLGLVPVKGRGEPMEVFELVGATPTRTRLQAAIARGLTRFVGRQAELDMLAGALEQARGGQGRVIALVGEPGVGKSRLFWELIRSDRVRDWLVLHASCRSYGTARSYLPLVDLLRTYFQLEDGDETRKIREKVTGKLLTLNKALESALPPLLALLDVPVDDRKWQDLDALQRRRRTLEAIGTVLTGESQVQPVLLVLEDLQWIDPESEAVLARLLEHVAASRILLLVNYRPEHQDAWLEKSPGTKLRIDSLPARSAEELLAQLLGEAAELAPLKRLLIERTEGNPFFLEESVRTLVETETLTGTRGAYTLGRPVGALQVPATVQAMLAARIDRLTPPVKRLLQAAGVIGRDVPLALLQAIADDSEEAVRGGLAHLQTAEFVYESRLFPDLEYTFTHALTHEVAVGTLLQERRRTLHARIVAAFEALYPDRLDEHVHRLAYHAVGGEVWDKAVPYLRRAGAKALDRSANREAIGHFEQALAAVDRLEPGRETLATAVDIRFELRNALLPLGEHGRIAEHLRAAEVAAAALGDQGRLGWVSAYTAPYHWMVGDYARAIETGERALAIGRLQADPALLAVANFDLGHAYHARGDYRQAADCLRTSVTAIETHPGLDRTRAPFMPSVSSPRTWLVLCLAELGEFAEGVACAEAAVRLAEAAEHRYSVAVAHIGSGFVHLRRGDLDRAIPALEHSLALSRAGGFPLMLAWTTTLLGYAYALTGRVAEALPLVEQGLEQAASMRARANHSSFLAGLGEAYLLAGRIDRAGQLAERALALARDQSEQGSEAYAFRLLGEIATRRDSPDVGAARAAYTAASALAERLGMRPLLAYCQAGLGQLCARTGDSAAAEAHLAASRAIARDLDMRLWLAGAPAGDAGQRTAQRSGG
jgi:class 3 adenylate cyclase/tetratricopeptide (TPR) repeat protein